VAYCIKQGAEVLDTKPQIIVLAGPNGAGKSTLAPALLREFGVATFVNADVIAQGLSAYNPETVSIEAGRLMLTRLKELAAERRSFAFETTLSSRSYAGWLKKRIGEGYSVHLVFVWLSRWQLSMERVGVRTRAGGHDIPLEDIQRRYLRTVKNFFQLYRPLAQTWSVYDNSDREHPVRIASGRYEHVASVVDEDAWERFRAQGS